MKINNEDEFYRSKNSSARIVMGCICSLFIITAVLGIVLMANQDQLKRARNNNDISKVATEEELEAVDEEAKSKLTSDDMDFWNMYDDQNLPEDPKAQKNASDKYDKYSEKANIEKEEEQTVSEDDVKATGLSANSVSDNSFNASDEGEPEIIEIDSTLPRCSYIVDGFRQENEVLSYYSSNRKISSFGINVSKYQGNINWDLVSQNRVDYAMIRMGVRGYSSGTVVIDESYKKNIEGALSHGIEVGIYFYSQAVTEQEAIEEANYAVAAANGYLLTYPIVFHTEEIANDVARTDNLTPQELSNIAKAFCDTVKGYGYKAMICGSKHQLATKLDLNLLRGYDLWLMDAPVMSVGQKLTMSEFPYQYAMWQYSTAGKIDGIEGPVDLDISFVDYKYR